MHRSQSLAVRRPTRPPMHRAHSTKSLLRRDARAAPLPIPVPPSLAHSPLLLSPQSMFRRAYTASCPSQRDEEWLRDTVPVPPSSLSSSISAISPSCSPAPSSSSSTMPSGGPTRGVLVRRISTDAHTPRGAPPHRRRMPGRWWSSPDVLASPSPQPVSSTALAPHSPPIVHWRMAALLAHSASRTTSASVSASASATGRGPWTRARHGHTMSEGDAARTARVVLVS